MTGDELQGGCMRDDHFFKASLDFWFLIVILSILFDQKPKLFFYALFCFLHIFSGYC
jgi:hypothetical protein